MTLITRRRIPLASNVQRSRFMEIGIRFLASVISVASVALVVVACSDDKEASTFGGGENDASTGDGPPVFGGSSSGGSSGGLSSGEGGTPGAKCEPTIANNYTANWTAPTEPTAPGPCNATTVGSYYDECLATLGKADHQTRCDAWKTANGPCGQCIEPTNHAGPIQWHRNRFYYTLNVAGCIAVQQDKYASTDCGYAYGAAVNCVRDACGGCWETGSSTFDDFRNCQNAAAGVGLCKTLQASQSSACPNVSTTEPTKGCFNTNNQEDTKVHYTRVMTYFCAQQ